ncbi:amidohydrolase family protein [Mesorhizobium sp. M0830]|uniref:amidohydrolase family protein n=1 Tax=Mesorhizobium sp. M0830 TaxID=2957008 RepID=UPI003337B37F
MIDAHHHIWRQTDLPWLLGVERPRIFGEYAAIRRDYLVEEFLSEIDSTGINKSVYIQANWAPNWAADEAAWVQATADRTGWPHAIVAFADVTVADVRPALDKLARVSLVRGIRHQLHWHENPLYRFASRPDLCTDPKVMSNIARLADYGFSFDLQVFASQMEGAAGLARGCPDVTFVLQHAGMLEDTSPEGRAAWKEGMKLLASCPNIATKLSAFGTFIHRNDPAFIADMVATTVRLFGANRCMFGSNFPIERLWTTYGELLSAFLEAASGLSKKARSAIFNDTAARLYRL